MKNMKWSMLVVAGVAAGFAGGVYAAGAKKAMALTPAADVKWFPMDPKDTEGKGPKMAVVFGDMKKKGPLGILATFPAGAKPGPHTHSSDYYAVVVKGVEHNWDGGPDEGAALPAGSHWYQPGKQVHDNHCEDGSECVVFIYSPNGFDFQPAKAPEAKAGGDMKSATPAPK